MAKLNISKNTGDTLSASELNQIVAAVNSKLDTSETNIYSNPDKNKLDKLPSEVYSKDEVDTKILEQSSGQVISMSETPVGILKYSGSAGVVSSPIYSQLSKLIALPKTLNDVKEYVLSDEPLGMNLYFSIDSFVISSGEKIKSEVFYSLYQVEKIYVTEDYKTKIVIKCMEATSLNLVANISVKYVKPYSHIVDLQVTLDSSIPPASVDVTIPTLKYDKDMIVSLTADDAHASSFCRLWAAINRRPISIDNLCYHANQLVAGDIPASIIATTFPTTLGYTDGCGNEKRFAIGVAIWPSSTSQGKAMMDTENIVDPSATNEYRFMTPYLQWPDMAVMEKYGCSIYQHNIETDLYGPDNNVENILAGFEADNNIALNRMNRGIKIMARPDGNNHFFEAATRRDQILCSTGESSGIDYYPFQVPVNLYKAKLQRFFPGDVLAEVKAAFISEYAKEKTTRKWFHFACHNANIEWCNLLKWFSDTHGKDGSDDIWFATLDEVYEYIYMRENAIIQKTVSGTTLNIKMFIPNGQYFYYPDFSILLSGINDQSKATITGSENIKGLVWGIKAGNLLLNIDLNPKLVDLSEEFTSKYEQTESVIDHSDALCFVNRLKPSLRASFLDRLSNESAAPILTQIKINNGAITTNSLNVVLTPIYSKEAIFYRVGAMSDLNGITWMPYSGGEIPFILQAGEGLKTVYLQLKNSIGESETKSANITYSQTSSEVILTSILISGSSSVDVSGSTQLSIVYTPANTTQAGVIWSSSNPGILTVDSYGKVTAIKPGNVIITATSTTNASITATKDITIPQSSTSSISAILGHFDWVTYRGKVLDTIMGKYLSIANQNNNSGIGDPNIYDATTGDVITGWRRMSDVEKITYYSLTKLDSFLGATSYNSDLSSISSVVLEYAYSYQYNANRYPVYGLNLDNGIYRVSILTSTSQDHSSEHGHLKINGIERPLPAMSFQNNTEWMVFDNIVVSDGKLALMFYTETSQYFGFNAIKIEKISPI